MRLDPAYTESHPALPGLPRGIYPYVGGSIGAADLHAALLTHGYATVPSRNGLKLAGKVPGTLVDPAQYKPGPASMSEQQLELFGYDEWLEGQRQAKVPIILTDSPRIPRHDRTMLRTTLERWRSVPEPTLVVLPIEPWWLKSGLPCLIDEVRAAQRPVALVVLHAYNGLDEAGVIAGLVTLASAVDGLPVVLLRCDISAVGAVAYGSFAGFVGLSATNRHGPTPRRRPNKDEDRDEVDESPSVFVPALHDYVKASRLPAISRDEASGVLVCRDPFCGGASLLRLGRLAEVDLAVAREQAYRHNLATHEDIARRVFMSDEPKDTWWELCKSGADTALSLIETGVNLTVSRWLRQWVELGSPSHEPTIAA